MFLWNYIRSKFLVAAWIFVVCAPAFVFHWVKENHPELIPPALMWVLVPAFLFYLGSSFYFYVGITRHMDEDPAITLWAALGLTFVEFRLLLRFIPIIGQLVEPDEDKTHYVPDDD